ncbi:MAG: 3-hydroxyacyl-CoA dehydrogenase NAD-binding domain-containing protein [Thermomicrobiales bacterium]
MDDPSESGIARVLVVGAGTMGNGIAQIVAEAGIEVILCDADPGRLEQGRNAVDARWRRAHDKGQLNANTITGFQANLLTGSLADAVHADLVIEAIVERLDAKAALLRQLDGIALPEAVFASNTSSISITALGNASGRPENVIGLHFFNPVPVLPLVEVVNGLATSAATTAKAVNFAIGLGKTPVVVSDAPGFVANRILLPMINEAIFTLQEGVASAADIDRVMKLGMAHPMGPLALADLIGLDICLDILDTLHRDFGDDKYRAAPLLKRMVAAGRLGRKTGQGFFEYATS